MSIMVSIYLREGLVMASSRLNTDLFSNNEINHLQKCTHKTYNDIGISIYGNPYYDYENLIESFILMNNSDLLSVSAFAQKFKKFLIELDLQSKICVHIGGYEKLNGQKKT